jgi:hypothetical protein
VSDKKVLIFFHQACNTIFIKNQKKCEAAFSAQKFFYGVFGQRVCMFCVYNASERVHNAFLQEKSVKFS